MKPILNLVNVNQIKKNCITKLSEVISKVLQDNMFETEAFWYKGNPTKSNNSKLSLSKWLMWSWNIGEAISLGPFVITLALNKGILPQAQRLLV